MDVPIANRGNTTKRKKEPPQTTAHAIVAQKAKFLALFDAARAASYWPRAHMLRSAVQNAQHLSDERGLDIDIDNLYVKTAVANEGPRMKRIRPAPMGRAFRYQRRIAHIIITVAEKKAAGAEVETTPEPVKKTAGKPAAKKTAAKKSPAKKAAAKKAPAKKKAAAK